MQAEPAKIFEQLLARLLGAARQIGVFDAQQEFPAIPVMTRQQPAEQRRARPADMEISRGRRRETRHDILIGRGHAAGLGLKRRYAVIIGPYSRYARQPMPTR